MPISATPYQITYRYAGDANFNGVSDNATTTLKVHGIPGPVVTNVLVGSTSWSSTFLSHLASFDSRNVGGYSLPVGSGSQLATSPWGSINQIKVVFSENVTVHQADLLLSGVNTTAYNVGGGSFSYDSSTFTATWTLPQTIRLDKLLLQLNADGSNPIEDSAGNRLDGEWTNPASTTQSSSSTYPSGDGTRGGDFLFRFNVLPGDATQNGTIDGYDLAKLLANYSQSGKIWTDGDFTGDGTIDGYDLAVLLANYDKTLPSAETPRQTTRPLLDRRAGFFVDDGFGAGPLAALFYGEPQVVGRILDQP